MSWELQELQRVVERSAKALCLIWEFPIIPSTQPVDGMGQSRLSDIGAHHDDQHSSMMLSTLWFKDFESTAGASFLHPSSFGLRGHQRRGFGVFILDHGAPVCCKPPKSQSRVSGLVNHPNHRHSSNQPSMACYKHLVYQLQLAKTSQK